MKHLPPLDEEQYQTLLDALRIAAEHYQEKARDWREGSEQVEQYERKADNADNLPFYLEAHMRPDEPTPIRCLVAIEGGSVHSFLADRPGLELTVIDYDTEGADEEDLFDIPQEGGKTAKAFRSAHHGEVSPAFIQAALGARPTNPEKRLAMLRHYAELSNRQVWGEAYAREADEIAAMLASA